MRRLGVIFFLLSACQTSSSSTVQRPETTPSYIDSRVRLHLHRGVTDRVFAALADPTRREIFERLAARPHTVNDLASNFPVSRPAVSQHLKILKDAGLVSDEARGTSRIYRIDPRGLGPLRRWLDEQWSRSLDNFKSLAEQEDKE